MSNINNKHIPEDLDSLTRKDMVGLFKIQVEEHQGFIKEIETLRTQLAKANERVELLEKCCKLHTLPPNVVFDMVEAMIPHEVNKFALEKKQEGVNDFMHHFRYEFEGARDTDSIESFADEFCEQLRKEQE